MKRVGRIIMWLIAIVVLVAGSALAYVRLASDDPRVWHIDPIAAERTGKPNDFVVAPDGGDLTSPVYAMSPAELMTKFREMALGQPRVELLGERDGFATFVQRSKLVAYPDYISVKAIPAEGGAQLHVFSRSRYGHSDLGVNKARISAWLQKL